MVRIGPIELPEFPLLLAPMEDVSDPPFRALCKKHGADLMFTEFISSEGLIRKAAKGLKKLDIFESERPIGIQLFGGSEDAMEEAARIAEEAGVPVQRLHKLAEGRRPNVLDMIKNGEIAMIVNTPSGRSPRHDEVRIRSAAIAYRIPITTTLRAARACAGAIGALRSRALEVRALQEFQKP